MPEGSVCDLVPVAATTACHPSHRPVRGLGRDRDKACKGEVGNQHQQKAHLTDNFQSGFAQGLLRPCVRTMIQIKFIPDTRFPPMAHYAAIMFLAGMGIPLLAALNAALGRSIGSPSAAALVLFCVALVVGVIATLLTGPGALAKVATAPRHLFLGGLFVAFYVLSVTYIAPEFGVGNAVFFVLIGQLVSAAAIDQFGLFGAQISPINLTRAAGIALMALGVWVTQQA